MISTPVILFTYNRLYHTKLTIEALLKNEEASETDLIIFSDASNNENNQKSVDEVRAYLKTIQGFNSVKIIERDTNFGLSKNIIQGITEMFLIYDQIIVLEDDLITSPFFLKYMNEALTFYKDCDEVISISGYSYPFKDKTFDTFFIKGADCWGWATWKRGWELFNQNGSFLLEELKNKKLEKEFNFSNSYNYLKMLENQVAGKTNSWAIRWYASAFLNNKLSLYPSKSLVFHNGSDDSGTNCTTQSIFDVELSDREIPVQIDNITESRKYRNKIIRYFRFTRKYRLLKDKLKSIVKK